MDFQIRRISQWHHDVAVSIDGTRVELGLHDEEQRKTLASTLREAADDLDPAATASHAAEVEALTKAAQRLCRSFPTDGDMAAAGWDRAEIDEACNAYDALRAALKGDKP